MFCLKNKFLSVFVAYQGSVVNFIWVKERTIRIRLYDKIDLSEKKRRVMLWHSNCTLWANLKLNRVRCYARMLNTNIFQRGLNVISLFVFTCNCMHSSAFELAIWNWLVLKRLPWFIELGTRFCAWKPNKSAI